MDMKKILQALDGVATKPVEGVDSMAKFLRVVKEADLNQSVIENIEDLGNGAQKKTNPDGTYEIGDGSGLKLYSADGKLIKIRSPNFSGFSQETDVGTGNVTKHYNAGPISTSQTTDKSGKEVSMKAAVNLGVGKLGMEREKGITGKSWTPSSQAGDEDPISQKDLYAMGNKDKEATYDRAMKQVTSPKESIERFLSIVAEGQGPLNRLTQAESIAVYHSEPVQTRETITSPVLNVVADAKPSMIGKYFKTIEQEFAESADRTKQKATELANRVIEGLKDPKDNPCWKGYKPVGTKKKNGKTVPNCVPK